MRIGFSAPRILDFDVESRPLGWYGGDFVHQEITAIAMAWVVNGEPEDLESRTLTKTDRTPARLLRWFLGRYQEADMVTGHYIRGFDLPLINAGLIELDMGTLAPILSHDTKLDKIKTHGISSSQENLGAMLETADAKVNMNTQKWRRANRLQPDGITEARQRVEGDVIQHIQLRNEMLRRGILGKPRVWDPGSTSFGGGDYTP